MNKWKLFAGVLTVGVVADQVTKQMIVNTGWRIGQRSTVIDGFFDLCHFRNSGIAFGLFRDGNPAMIIPIFVILALAAVGFLVFYLRQEEAPPAYLVIGLGLIGSGAVGNAIDRVYYGEVVDFLLFYIDNHYWPAFNVADAAITCGAVLLGWDMLRRPHGNKQTESEADESPSNPEPEEV